MCITIIGIPVHLLQRIYAWAAQSGEEVAIQSEADKIIAKMNQLVDHEKDTKKKKVYKEKLDKLIEQNKKFDERERF